MDAARPLTPSGFESGPPAEGGGPGAPATPGGAIPSGDGRVTPMMEQYIEIKTANPDCLLFYRMGDFYELFFDDAEVASRALGIVLTKRGKHLGHDIPMCGVPIERADEYLHRLIALGHRVAVCEQLEDPAEARKRGSKSVVRRDVVRLVTPGTLTEDTLLDARRNNYLLAIARARASVSEESRFALAWIDISTAEFRIAERDRAGLAVEDRAARTGRDHRVGRALWRCRACALPALAAGGDAAHSRRIRRCDRRAPACGFFRTGHDRKLWCALAPRTHRGCRLHHLCRAHATRQAPAALGASTRGPGRDPADRPGDARKPRTRAHACGRTRGLAACRGRPHRDTAGLAPSRPAPVCAAHRAAGDRAAARRGRAFRCRRRCARRAARAPQGRTRPCPLAIPAGRWPRRPT